MKSSKVTQRQNTARIGASLIKSAVLLAVWRMCSRFASAILASKVIGGHMQNSTVAGWDALSDQLAGVAQQLDKSIVCVDGGHRIGSSGIIWRPGIVVTASHMLRRTEHIEVTFGDQSRAKATLAGRDTGTDVAVLRLENAGSGAPAQLSEGSKLRLGQLVLALGRSRLGDLAASSGII